MHPALHLVFPEAALRRQPFRNRGFGGRFKLSILRWGWRVSFFGFGARAFANG
jgi:hypothetical protein